MSRNSQSQQQQPAFVVYNDEDALVDVNTAFLIKSPGGISSSSFDETKPIGNDSITQQLFEENEFVDLTVDNDDDERVINVDDDDYELVIKVDNDDNDDDVVVVRTDSNSNTNDDNENGNAEERRRQYFEEQQSIELARQLMAEEAMLSYHHHIQYLRESANELSQEDYDALQRALQEDVEENQETNSILDNDNGSDEFDDDDDDDDNNDGEADLSYETMLYLSERIGDVKTERWTMISQREINKLPTFQYGNTTVTDKECGEENDSEHKCLICQCEYERGEELARLPCHHVFHKDCVAHWLSTKDVCAYCRQCIVPDKDQK